MDRDHDRSRRGEVSALRENRFDFGRQQVRVSANYIVKQGNRIEKAPKDGEGRVLSLDLLTCELLLERFQRRRAEALFLGVTWAERTPKDASAVAHELAAGLDQRARALGEQLTASPEPWLAGQLGVLAPHASPLLREDYARRAAAAAAYREAAGITDPKQAITPEPHRGNPELDHLRRSVIRALEIRDETEITRRMTSGELEARILGGEPRASAPPDVSRELRLTAQAEADAWQQSADTEIRHDPAGTAGAKALARHMATRREQFEAANNRYETWATDTGERREAAGKASAELERRGLARQPAEQQQPETGGEPPTMLQWWRQLDADIAAVDPAIDREHHRTFDGRAAILSSCMTGTVSSPSPRRPSWAWPRQCGPARRGPML